MGQAWRSRRIVYPDAEQKAGPEPKIWERLRVDAGAAAKPRLLGFALAGSMIGVPCAVVFAMLPYFLEWSSGGSASDAGLFSVLLLARTAVSLAALWGT